VVEERFNPRSIGVFAKFGNPKSFFAVPSTHRWRYWHRGKTISVVNRTAILKHEVCREAFGSTH